MLVYSWKFLQCIVKSHITWKYMQTETQQSLPAIFLWFIHHDDVQSVDNEMIPVKGRGADLMHEQCQLYWGPEEHRTALLLHTNWTHQEFRLACTEQEYCANAFMMGSSNLSFAKKSWVCTSMIFLAEIISFKVDCILTWNTALPDTYHSQSQDIIWLPRWHKSWRWTSLCTMLYITAQFTFNSPTICHFKYSGTTELVGEFYHSQKTFYSKTFCKAKFRPYLRKTSILLFVICLVCPEEQVLKSQLFGT